MSTQQQLIAQAMDRANRTAPVTKAEAALLKSVFAWAKAARATEAQIIDELVATLEPEREVSGGPVSGRGVVGADIVYHGAPING